MSQTANWPKDCIPVPIETFKRMMEEASLARNTFVAKEEEEEIVSVEDNIDEIPKSGDDTSNDAADLSQEHIIKRT